MSKSDIILKICVINHNERGHVSFGKWEYIIQTLIVLSLAAFAIETLPNISHSWLSLLRTLEVITVTVFTIEYLVRIFLCRPPLSYVLSFYGIIDLLAILPFYVTTGVDLRSLRALRLMRLFRLLKLVRYSAAMKRFYHAFVIAREELILFGAAALILLYLSAVGIYYFERTSQPEAFASVFHALWWSVGTLTTVGYGDVYPITIGGKIFTFLVLMIGLGIVAVPSGLFASALLKAREYTKVQKENKNQATPHNETDE